MNILHTSDWHLGQNLAEKTREEEMNAFFSFLRDTIEERDVEALLISGDIFDTSSPSSSTLEQYYRFLASIQGSKCKDVFVIAGNHDSPSVLASPKEILEMVNVHVYSTREDVEPYVLCDKVVILPIPFPRDQELRRYVQGESFREEEDKLRRAIEDLYRRETEDAISRYGDLPIVAMGHLMASSVKDDEKMDLYIGGLGSIDASSFPRELSYVALGHVHKPQRLNKEGTICYSGSPIPMTFKEGKDQKIVKLIKVEGRNVETEDIPLPLYRSFFQIAGDKDHILSTLTSLVSGGKSGWVDIEITECGVSSSVRTKADEIVGGSGLEILHIKDATVQERIISDNDSVESLDDLSEEDVFLLVLEANGVTDEKKPALISAFREIVKEMEEEEKP